MAPNSARARAIRAGMVNEARQEYLDAPMRVARLSHEDTRPIGTLVWVETQRMCNGHKEMVVKCKGGWVAFTKHCHSGTERGLVHLCEEIGLPSECAPYTAHINTARQFRRVAQKMGVRYLWKNRGAQFFQLPPEMVAKLPVATRKVDRFAEGMTHALADCMERMHR